MSISSDLSNKQSFIKAKLVILFQYGGLGNQFFQYLAIKSIAPHALIVCIGYQDLFSCIAFGSLSKTQALQSRIIRALCARLGVNRIRCLAKHLRLIGYISEDIEGSRLKVKSKRGLFSTIHLQEGFFQDASKHCDSFVRNFPLRRELLQAAREWLVNNIKSQYANPYFLHIRRGDYVNWPTPDHPAVLPCSWYNRQIREIARSDPNAYFIVFSNDIPFAHEFFGSRSRFTVFQGSLAHEFALMAACSYGGILSASSLSWWAAYYGKQLSQDAKYIAPHYWAGWRTQQWYPPLIKASWLHYRYVYS